MNQLYRGWPVFLALSISQSLLSVAQAAVPLTVDFQKVVGQVDDRIYGHFLEHIYHSCNGGLWGDIVWNRSFEELQPVEKGENPPSAAFARHWGKIGTGQISLDTQAPLNSQRSVMITAESAGTGLTQKDYCVRRGDTCRGSFWMRGEAVAGFLVRLMDGEQSIAEQTVPPPSPAWQEFKLELTPTRSAANASLQMVALGKAVVWVDQVSLMPDSYRANGGFRTDLLQAIADLKPATIRWPGGSFLGDYQWKNGIGPQSKRIGKRGWDEQDPLSFGLDEFMALCRKLNSEPVLVFYLGPRNNPGLRSKYVQEALDELDYCNGPASTVWGKVRAANGHPEPYGVKYWEVDNELWMSKMPPVDYDAVVKGFSEALRARDPSIQIIACGGRGTDNNGDDQWNLKLLAGHVNSYQYLSLHHYEGPDRYAHGVTAFETHFNNLRDLITRSANPDLKLYLSEWNAQSTDWRTGLYAAGLLNVMERNSDIVPMACPALWLRHVTAPAWDNAFINFDHRTWFPAPNYVVMKLWRDHFATTRLALDGDPGPLNAVATRSDDQRKIWLKAANPSDRATEVTVSVVRGFEAARATLKLVAPDDLKARNTLAQRDAVRVVAGKVELAGGKASFVLPRWSAGVLELEK